VNRGGRIRVLHVIPSVAARYGGPSQAIGPMCRSLIDAGVEVTLAATDADGRGRLNVQRGVPTTWDGVPAIIFRRDATEAFKYSFGLARWLRSHVADYDVVHVHAVLSHASLAAAAACRKSGIPYIVRPLGTIAQWSLSKKAVRKRILLTFAAKRMLAGAAAIHCTSEDERRDAEQTLGLTQGVVIPLGVDAAAFAPGADADAVRARTRYVLSLSRLHPKKNLDTLIDAFAAARERHGTGWSLVIAGGGDDEYARRLEQRARSRGISDAVRFTGWVDGARKRELLTGASLFALPSHHENFGVSVLEASAAGVPSIVASSVQLASDIAAMKSGWIVASDSELAGTLGGAMSDDVERIARGEAARRMADRFSWPSAAFQLRTLYSRVLRELAAHRETALTMAGER
jgi:glycosyltransferase involved in cell wall biosynthesis